MKTIEQTRRELFEAEYCRRNDCELDFMQKDGNYYQRDSAQIAWGWFNAALDTVAIELPVWEQYDDEDMHGASCAIQDCRTAIESTNLGLKIK